MKELGIDYFISYTDSITDKAIMSDELENLFQSSPFTVFKIYSDKVQSTFFLSLRFRVRSDCVHLMQQNTATKI